MEGPRQKAGFLIKPEKLQNHSNKGKGKEQKKERGDGKEEKRKKAMVALLLFIMATSDTKGPFGDNVFKHPAGCHILLSLPTVLTVDENHVNNLLMTLATSFHYFKTKHQQCSLLALLVSQSLLSFLVRRLIQLNLVVPVYPWFHSLHRLPNTVLPQLVSIEKWCTNAIV